MAERYNWQDTINNVDCPYCHSKKKEWCAESNGKKIFYPHADRRMAYNKMKEGKMSIVDDLQDKLNVDLECELNAKVMITSSIVVKQLEKSRDIIVAEALVIQGIMEQYEEVLETAEDAVEKLNEVIEELSLLETIKEA